ncbi:hypothetical protein L1887_05010 [Cichorium endivia]|nr:hypothetical protein L1887_05010 [Cichorium endivia]
MKRILCITAFPIPCMHEVRILFLSRTDLDQQRCCRERISVVDAGFCQQQLWKRNFEKLGLPVPDMAAVKGEDPQSEVGISSKRTLIPSQKNIQQDAWPEPAFNVVPTVTMVGVAKGRLVGPTRGHTLFKKKSDALTVQFRAINGRITTNHT